MQIKFRLIIADTTAKISYSLVVFFIYPYNFTLQLALAIPESFARKEHNRKSAKHDFAI